MPGISSGGGGSHDTSRDVEVRATTVRLDGAGGTGGRERERAVGGSTDKEKCVGGGGGMCTTC